MEHVRPYLISSFRRSSRQLFGEFVVNLIAPLSFRISAISSIDSNKFISNWNAQNNKMRYRFEWNFNNEKYSFWFANINASGTMRCKQANNISYFPESAWWMKKMFPTGIMLVKTKRQINVIWSHFALVAKRILLAFCLDWYHLQSTRACVEWCLVSHGWIVVTHKNTNKCFA